MSEGKAGEGSTLQALPGPVEERQRAVIVSIRVTEVLDPSAFFAQIGTGE